MLAGINGSHAAAVTVPDQNKFFECERIDDRRHVLRHGDEGIIMIPRRLGLPVPTHVKRNRQPGFAQMLELGLPLRGVAGQ